MKTKLQLTAVLCFLAFLFASAQTTLTPQQWNQTKKEGKLDGKAKAAPETGAQPFVEYKLADHNPTIQTIFCQPWVPEDNSWSIAPFNGGSAPNYANDDGSTGLINLPFSYCLYGTTYNSCYINNNGNISFGAPYGTFTASGFPNASFVMVAPFWGDVDTQGGASGFVHFVITPTYMVVHWDSVGYYSAHSDKLNTFQLVISDGIDPIIQGGNTSFAYKDMQWTTGDASGGVGGFDGSYAVVGANKGDGINYIQFGEFSRPGGVYNGPTADSSGIDWLDYKYFIFNACTNTNNVAPIASGIQICDTLNLCIGDTLPLNALFFSPEASQITTVNIDTTGTTGYVLVSNTPGSTASLNAYFVGSLSNAGYNAITITATDDGSPPATTTIPMIIHVLAAPIPVASNDTTICAGTSAQLNASGGLQFTWTPPGNLNNPNIPNPIASPPVTTTYTVNVSNGSCSANETVVVTVTSPVAVAGPDTSVCLGSGAQLNATGGVSYSWTPTSSLNNPNIANPIASPTVATTYTCTVTNSQGCTDTDIATVTVAPSPTSLFTQYAISNLPDSNFYFTDQSSGGVVSWLWEFGDGGSSTLQNPTHSYATSGSFHICLITTNSNGCQDTACQDVFVIIPPVYAPNVFTPNSDGTNDLFEFKNLEYYRNAHLEIYDRWGTKVYTSDNYQNDWNGKKMGNGGECIDGTYYYILSGSTKLDPMTGFVELIRGK